MLFGRIDDRLEEQTGEGDAGAQEEVRDDGEDGEDGEDWRRMEGSAQTCKAAARLYYSLMAADQKCSTQRYCQETRGSALSIHAPAHLALTTA